MRQLFETRDRPLYGSAVPMRLERLADADISEYVAARFAESGRRAGEALHPLVVDARRGTRSGRCCSRTGSGTSVGAGETATLGSWERRMQGRWKSSTPEFDARWRGFDLAEQKTLRAVIAGDGSPYKERALAPLDLSKATAQSALERLEATADVEREGDAPSARRPALRRVGRAPRRAGTLPY